MAAWWLTPPHLLISYVLFSLAVYDYELLQWPNFTLWIIQSDVFTLFFAPFPWLAPPSAPKIYLQIPPNPQTGQWALLCVTGEFHPRNLTLIWTYQSEAVNIDQLSVTNCTLPAIHPHGNLSAGPADAALLSSGWLVNSMPPRQPQCFQVMNNHNGEVYLFSMFFLPLKQSLDTGITFTCAVQDHPAMTTALTASFTWGKKIRSTINTMHWFRELCNGRTH